MKKRRIISIAVFLLAFSLLNIHADKPFWGIHDWNGVRNGNIARNYLKYGLIQTKLGQVENSGPADPRNFSYYTHFPPVLTLMIAASYKIFGVSECATRLVPSLISSLSVVFIFLIGEILVGWEVGLLASSLAIVTPLVLYFGKNPVQEPLVVFFVLVSFYCYLNLTKNKIFHWLFVINLILSALTTWAGYFLIPAITLTSLLRGDYKIAKKLLPYWLLSLVLFLLYLLYVRLLTGSFIGGGLLASLLQRSGVGEIGRVENLTIISYFSRLRLWYTTLFTSTLCLLSIFWFLTKLVTKKISTADWHLFTLGIFGVTYSLIFINSSYIHNYLIFYQLPFISLTAATASSIIIKKMSLWKYHWPLFVALVLIVFFERFSYLKALDQSSADSFSVKLGQFINREIRPNETIIIKTDPLFWSATENFLKYYSDRKLIYSETGSGQGLLLTIDSKRQIYHLVR